MSKQIFKNIRLLSLKRTDIVHLIKNTFWYGLLNSIYSLSLFLLVPYMTGKLSPNDYGLYSLYILFLMIITPIIGCGLSQAVMRTRADTPKNKQFAQYVSSSLFLLFIILLGALSIVLVFSTPLSYLTSLPTLILVCATISAFMLECESIVHSILQVEKKPLIFGFWRILRTCSFFLLVFIGLRTEQSYKTVVFVELFMNSCSVIACFCWFYKNKLLTPSLDFRLMREAFHYGYPIIFYMVSILIYSTFNRIFLNHYGSTEDVGLFFTGYQIGMAMSLVVQSVSQAVMPFSFEWMQDTGLKNAPSYERVKKWILAFFMILALFMYALFTYFFDYCIAPSFEAAKTVFPWVIVAFTLNGFYRLDSFYLFYAKKTQSLALITFASCCASFLYNGLLIPKFGIVGASIALALSYGTTVILTKATLFYYRQSYTKV